MYYDKLFITDISVNEEVAEKLENSYFGEVQLLDHHKTAEWLNKYSWAKVEDIDVSLNDKTSGTFILYRYLYNDNISTTFCRIKNFADLVRQYDTWIWNRDNFITPKELNDLFYLYGFDRFINKILDYMNGNCDLFSDTDKFILELKKEEINKYIESKEKELIVKEYQGYKCGIVFAEQHISVLGNELCKRNDDIDLCIIVTNGKTLSFRAVKDNVDVSVIAKSLGGGGHLKASGSQISIEDRDKFLDIILK